MVTYYKIHMALVRILHYFMDHVYYKFEKLPNTFFPASPLAVGGASER
jgi:hypothetical protein